MTELLPTGDPIDSGAAYSERWISVQDGVELRVMEWWPEGTGEPPLYFVAGWVSVVEGWRPLLEVLVRRRPVVYIETREKRSAKIDRRRLRVEEFSVQRLAEDLCEIARVVGADRSSAIWFGSSMGSTAILEGLKGGQRVGHVTSSITRGIRLGSLSAPTLATGGQASSAEVISINRRRAACRNHGAGELSSCAVHKSMRSGSAGLLCE